MAYEKHTWETGETITAEKLNNLEDGVSGNNNNTIVLSVVMDHNDSPSPAFTKEEFERALENIDNTTVVLKYNNRFYNLVEKDESQLIFNHIIMNSNANQLYVYTMSAFLYYGEHPYVSETLYVINATIV